MAFWMLEKGKFGYYFSLKKKKGRLCELVSSVCPSIGVNLRAQTSLSVDSLAWCAGWRRAFVSVQYWKKPLGGSQGQMLESLKLKEPAL